MDVIFIHGPAASGKLTVGRELSFLTGLPLFHNHLTIDLVMALFPFGSPPFIELRERIWLESFAAAAKAGQSFIFTFAPEATVPPSFIPQCQRVVAESGGRILFVKLTCPAEVIESRLTNESRRAFGKLTSLEHYRRLRAAGAFEFGAMPESFASIATDQLAPRDAATIIQQLLGV